MSHFTRSGTVLIILAVVASMIYLSLRDDKNNSDPIGVAELSAGAAAPAKEAKAQSSAPSQDVTKKSEPVAAKEHGDDCAHCAAAKKTSAEADPQLLTTPDADPYFKKLARMEDKVIPADTFDFLRGSQKGDEAGFKIGELEFRGTISHVRENHAKARSYGIELDQGLGRVLVKTDAAEVLVANIFFMDDSRVILASEARVEGQGKVIKLKETTIASLLCAPPDTILTASGLRTLSDTNALTLAAPTKALTTPTTPLAIPALEGQPDSDYVIYLDFDGETVTGTDWNTLSGSNEIVAIPVPRADEDEWVRLVWRRVVEDFAPFNINVTTDEAVFNAPGQDPTKRLHVIITSTDDASPGAGGVAFLWSFREDTPIVWAFNDSEYTCATTISHEAGHAFGLSHDGLVPFDEYYPGHNGSYAPGWAPIMGAAFLDLPYDEVDQWSIGDYTNSTNTEDDLAIIGDDVDPQIAVGGASNGFGFIADDYADAYNQNGLGGFEIIGNNEIQASGLISRTSDIDVFGFSATEGLIRFVISPLDVNSIYSELGSDTSGANLAVNVKLLDADGQVLAEGVPTGGNLLTSLIETSVEAGTYYIAVDGGGRGTGPDTGFSDYGSLGQYNIFGELALPPLAVSGGTKQTVTIFNGVSSVNSSNGTDFGFTTPGNGRTNTFFLENTGEIVEITNLEIDLADGTASQFDISAAASFDSILPEGGQFFEITYNPSTTGTHSDMVVITYEAGGPQVFEFTVRGSATNSQSADNYESNNNANVAYSLNDFEETWLEDVKGLAFFISDQNDWYSFTASGEDDLIRIDTSLAPDADNVRFNLVHNNGRDFVILASTTGDRMQYLIPESFSGEKRKFYIHVQSTADSTVRNAYDLRWSAIELIAGDDDLYEDNNSREDAFDLTNAENQLSQIFGLAVSKDEDWYKIDIDQDPFIRMLYVAALFDHAQGNIDIEVYRETVLREFSATQQDKEVLTVHDNINFDNFAEPFTFTPDNNFLVMGVEPGTYYIRVTGDFAGNNYDLIVDPRIDDRYEVINASGTENDTLNNAFPLGEEIVGQWLSDIDGVGTTANYPDFATATNFANTGDDDWYSFSIGGTDTIGQISLDFRNLNGGGTVGFFLYSSAGVLLTSTQDDLGTLGVLTVNEPTGRDFFVRVNGSNLNDSALSGYDFLINFTSVPPFIDNPVEDNYEENDNFLQLFNISANEGRYLSSIAGYGTQLDPDWYQISIPGNAAKLEASLVFVHKDGDLDLTLSKKDGPRHFVSSNGSDNETIIWENPIPGQYALTVTGENLGNFYNLLWDITFSEDNYEENDSFGQSFDLTGFESRLLNKLDGIAIQADNDWYRISAGPDTVELRAAITFANAEGDIDLALYNAGGSLISRSISTTDNELLVYDNPPEGDYFLRVYFGNESNEYDLSWSALTQAELDLIPEGDDSYEENDSLEQPYVLEGSEQRLSEVLGLGIQKDEDWYQIEVPADNLGLRVEAFFTDSLGDIDLEIYDPLGFPLAVRDSIDDNETLVLDSPVPQGLYAVRVYGPNLGNEYDLYWNPHIEDIYEENDVVGEAYDITLLLGSPLSNEGVPTLGDDDWYEFNVSGDLPFISIELDYKNINGAINFELFDSSLNVIATADSVDDFESVLFEAAIGKYYVRVYGENRYNTYDLKVSVIGDDQYEENDTAAEAFDITSLPSFQAVQFDDDWYAFTITDSNNFLSVNAGFTHSNGNIDVFLYNSADLNTPIGSATSDDNNESMRVPGVAGTYYIQITGDDTNQAYQLSWTVAPDDEFEQNDILDDATNIASNEGDAISALQFDEDWFEISVGPGKLRLVVDLLFSDASGDLNLTLYDSDGEELVLENTSDDNEQIAYSVFPFGTAAETFYIKVDGASVGTEYDLIWTTSTEDNFEGDTGNNRFFTASDDLLSSEGQKISSTIGYGGSLNEDWYKVQINPGDEGIVIETFSQHTVATNIDLELFAEGEIFLKRSVGLSDVERIHFKGSPGTYYLRVFGSVGENPYDLVWNSYSEDDLEPAFSLDTPKDPPNNDTPEFPRELQYMLANLTARGSSSLEFIEIDNLTQLDEDWYLFTVFSGEDVFILDLEFDHRFGDIDVALYNRDTETLIEQSESESNLERITASDLPPGEYLICVYGYGIYNPKSEAGWTPGSFNPYTEDYTAIEENTVAGFEYYELAEEIAHSLANTYSMRWRSFSDDGYDIETIDPSDIEINDTLGTSAVPQLIDQNDVEDLDGVINGDTLTLSENNCQGEVVLSEFKPTYEYFDLTQLDDDWYKFTIDTGGNHNFYVAIRFRDFQANTDLFLYDDSNTLLVSSESDSSSSEVIEIQGSGRQDYYVKVVGEDLGIPYDLEVRGHFDDLYEENDSISAADENANITELCGVPITGLVQRDDDLFRVDIPRDQVNLNFETRSFLGGIDVEVLDSEGNPLPAGYEVSGNTDNFSSWAKGVISPEAGTYYLKVTGSDEGVSYEIEWSYDNVDGYEGFFNNDDALSAYDLARLRLEPTYDPKGTYREPIKEFDFDYDLLSNLYFSSGFLVDAFGHAIQESDDWYAIKIPSWFLTTAKRGNDNIQVLKREYYVRLFAEIEFTHVDGDINLEIYNENDLINPIARSETSNNTESLAVGVDPTSEALTYYLRVYGDDNENDYSLKWDVSEVDAYEELEDEIPENDTNNFVDMAYDLTRVEVAPDSFESTEQTWLHELEYLQDVNGDGTIDVNDGGFKSPTGYGKQRTDDWYAVVVSEGATQLEVDCRFYSDNDTGYTYAPDDLDIDFEVYFLAGNDGDPGTRDLRKPVLVGRSIGDTDESLFSTDGNEAKALSEDITTEIGEAATFDVDEPGIYLIRVYYDNRSHPYTFYWDDIGDTDNSGDAAIIDDYLNGNWSYDLPAELPSAAIVDPDSNLDADRFTNSIEFALGMDTTVADYAVIGQSIAEIDGKQYYQFEYIRNRNAKGLGFEFIVQESDDLTFWDAQAVWVANKTVDGNPDLQRVIYRCSKPMDEQDKCFFRLVINEPPTTK